MIDKYLAKSRQKKTLTCVADMQLRLSPSKLYIALFLLPYFNAHAAETLNTKAVEKEKTTALPTMTVTATTDLNPPNSKPQLDVKTQTGSRLGLTSRETPASVTVIDRETITQRGAQTTQEALERAPGILTSSQPGSAGSVSMRGFTGGQITQLFNGLSVQYDVIAARPIDSWLMDRVEVLGGPSSFLYGQGAVGGSVNYVTKIAQREKSHHTALINLGEYLNRRASYGYNGQLGNSKNWFRADISYLGSDGYIDNTKANSGVMSFSLLSDITDKLSHTIAVEHQLEDRNAYWGTPILNPTIGGKIVPWGDARITSPVTGQIDPNTRFKNYNVSNPVFDQQVTWVRDIVDYNFSPSLQFKNTLYFYNADRQYKNVEVYDWNNTNTAIVRSSPFATKHEQSMLGDKMELAHDGKVFGMPLKTSAGIDVVYNKQYRSPGVIAATTWTTDPYNYIPLTYESNSAKLSAKNELLTVSGFIENRLTLIPKLNLVTGLRVDSIDLDNKNFLAPTAPTTANPFGSPASFHRHWDAVTWRAALMYDITDSFNVYAQYSTAADPPSGILMTGALTNFRNFDLTTGRQAEIGSKFDFWNKRGSGTVAAYYIERKNLSMPDPQNVNSVIPVGAQSSIGVEANLGLQINPEWSVQGNMAYTDAQFDDFTEVVGTTSVSRVGNRPTNVATWISNSWLTWQFHPDWRWNFGARYVGDRYGDNANLMKMPAYAVFDMKMDWQFNPHAMVTTRVKNLTDEVYSEWGRGGNTPMLLMREPRTFQMELKLDF